MPSQYERLLEAAAKLRGWRDAATVARELTKAGYNTSDQTMTNWKTRGISASGCLAAAIVIGCRPAWLLGDEGPMEDNPAPRLAEPQTAVYEFNTQAMNDVAEIMRALDPPRQKAVFAYANLQLHEQQLSQPKPIKRTGN